MPGAVVSRCQRRRRHPDTTPSPSPLLLPILLPALLGPASQLTLACSHPPLGISPFAASLLHSPLCQCAPADDEFYPSYCDPCPFASNSPLGMVPSRLLVLDVGLLSRPDSCYCALALAAVGQFTPRGMTGAACLIWPRLLTRSSYGRQTLQVRMPTIQSFTTCCECT